MNVMARNTQTRMLRSCDAIFEGDTFFTLAFRDIYEKYLHPPNRSTNVFTLAAAVPRNKELAVRTIAPPAPGDCCSLVVGRHDHAGLSLQTDSTLSLRHATVILSSDREGAPFIRVIDLNSVFGLQDIAHDTHRSLAANGPVALRLADAALFIFPPSSSFESAGGFDESAGGFDDMKWADVMPHDPDQEPEEQLNDHASREGRSTAISVVADINAVPPPGDTAAVTDTAGTVEMRSLGQTYRRLLSRHALRRGVLIGRYARCDINTANLPMAADISRIHALLISIDNQLHLVDAGSKNGVRTGAVYATEHAVADDTSTSFVLGGTLLLKWIPHVESVEE